MLSHVFFTPQDANFLLVRFGPDATAVYDYLLGLGIGVRNRTSQPGCAGTLCLTMGMPAENEQLVAALRQYRFWPCNLASVAVLHDRLSVAIQEPIGQEF